MFASVLLLALLPGMVHCWWPIKRQIPLCLTQQQAQIVANNYAELFTSYSNTLANNVLTPNFVDQTDSVDWLINDGKTCPVPFGSDTFASRAAFEKGSGSQPDIPFQIENIWIDCSNVIVRWVSAQTPEPVRGIAVLSTVFTPNINQQYQFQINHIYSEFNSGAWGVNVGICKIANPNTC